MISELVDWTQRTFEPLGAAGLFILAFIESSFFPIPPDLLLIVLCLGRPEFALLFALVCTIGSVLGGMFGYMIGRVAEDKLLVRFIKKRRIEQAHRMFERYGPFAVLVAAFTPIPYKVFTISAGLFYLDFKKFIIASFIGRGIRFLTVALLVMMWGRLMVDFIEKYFNVITIAVVVLGIIGYFAYRLLRR